MSVEVTQNLTQITISSVGVAGISGTSGTSGVSQDLSHLATTASFNSFTSSYLTDSASFDSRITAATNEQDLSHLATTASFNSFTSSQDLVNLGISTFTGSIREEVGGIEAYTASLKGQAIVSSSTQISNYHKFAETASANTFYGTQTFSGSFNVSGSTVQTGDNTLIGNTTLSGSIFISGSRLFTGETITIGNTILSGSIAMSGSTIQSGDNTLTGNNTITGSNLILGDTVMSGSIDVSGSSNFHNSRFVVTGSSYFTGSHFVDGNSVFSGSINIASGSSYYRAGNKLFNYGQWGSVQTQSGSANTAYAMKFDTKMYGSEGVSITNNGSGFPTRLTIENKGLYNIQFSAQLHTTANEACDFSVWFAMTGSNMENSNTDFSVEKVAGGGFATAALNFLTPIEANDWIELYWSNTTGNGQLQYKAPQSTPNRPATPSVIVTVTQVA